MAGLRGITCSARDPTYVGHIKGTHHLVSYLSDPYMKLFVLELHQYTSSIANSAVPLLRTWSHFMRNLLTSPFKWYPWPLNITLKYFNGSLFIAYYIRFQVHIIINKPLCTLLCSSLYFTNILFEHFTILSPFSTLITFFFARIPGRLCFLLFHWWWNNRRMCGTIIDRKFQLVVVWNTLTFHVEEGL